MEQTFASLPSEEELIPADHLKEWVIGARLFLQTRMKADELTGGFEEAVEALRRRMSSLETSLLSGTAEGEARQAFIIWLREKATKGVWVYYAKAWIEDKRLKAAEAALKIHAQRIDRARGEAVKARNNPAAMGRDYGTVIAGVSDSASDDYWIGTSGAYAYAAVQHPLMQELLAGVGQAEDWPVNACAEVDAMNQYLIARGHTAKNQIPPGTLYFHAETYNHTSKKWQSRSTCANCDTWVAKIDGRRC
jgi:hypothetical protein